MRAKRSIRSRLCPTAVILPIAGVVILATAWGPKWAAMAVVAALCTAACLLARRIETLGARSRASAEPSPSQTSSVQDGTGSDAASESKDSFAAYLAHEFRTPMTSILGFTEVLLESDSPAGERQDALLSIQRNSRHLLDLINDLLDFSKINAGQMAVERVECELPELIAQAAGLTRPAILNKGLEFKLTLDGPVPQRVRTDPLRVRQILVNLIANATRFTAQGSVELRVGCRVGCDGDGLVRFAVIDSGIGMTAEQAAHLFRPFGQADASIERRFGGTGLGLSIARSLARLLGGDITVQSAPGKGTTFTAEIGAGALHGVPTLDRLVLPEPDEAAPNDDAATPPTRLSGKVLLAEDGIDTQRLIARHLTRAGATVTVVGTGRAAVERLSVEPFDLVLMDLRMPDLDGYAAVERLRAEGCTTPVLALTANATQRDCDRCLASGFDGYLTKPIEKRKLLADLAPYLPARPSTATTTGAMPTTDETDAPLVSLLANDPDIRDLLGDFVGVLPGKVNDLNDRLARRDMAGLRDVAHQIKGAAGGYGFPAISASAGQLETQVQSGVPRDTLERSVSALVSLIRRVQGYSLDAEHPPRRDVA
jgi:signal transduction histidine kinase/CheY-like chemotaxis protein/HPt (histidine-containing phosphotransfer) domain-containing protein